MQCVPKKCGMTMLQNENNELIYTQIVDWQICIGLHETKQFYLEDRFPLSFINQMLDRMARRSHFSCLDGYSEYNQILILCEDREKMPFTYLCGIFAFHIILFVLCNTPTIFQRYIMVIFTVMVKDIMEVFI